MVLKILLCGLALIKGNKGLHLISFHWKHHWNFYFVSLTDCSEFLVHLYSLVLGVAVYAGNKWLCLLCAACTGRTVPAAGSGAERSEGKWRGGVAFGRAPRLCRECQIPERRLAPSCCFGARVRTCFFSCSHLCSFRWLYSLKYKQTTH